MSKYPIVLLFRYDRYNSIDTFLTNSKDKLNCEIKIIDKKDGLINLFDPNYMILATFGPDEKEYHKDVFESIAPRMASRWIHYKEITDPLEFSRGVNYCFLNTVIGDRVDSRPIFSVFTTCYNSYEKIKRPLNSLLSQSLVDWEWVILDDSPDDKHFTFLKQLFNGNKKIRLYKRSENSGNIGNVKNEAVSLCRGKYVLELDHDDDIVPELLKVSADAFEKYPEAGFAYTDFINMYETGENYWYGDFFALGYGGYYNTKYNGKWVNVYTTPQVNNITLSHLVSLPNHARMWRRTTLMELGNYSEFLPINDDQEILMRTCMGTKMIKIPIMGYVQYMNHGNNNFSLIRNSEINRIGPQYLVPQYYKKYNVHKRMKEMGAYDDEKYMNKRERVWLRDDFVPQYWNHLYQADFDLQVCIVGRDVFRAKLEEIKILYGNPRIDFFLIDDSGDRDGLCKFLDDQSFGRMRCYTIKDLTKAQMIKYFNYIFKTAVNSMVFDSI
jgi:glycosyltransferase involved in cell wall biosynthesis